MAVAPFPIETEQDGVHKQTSVDDSLRYLAGLALAWLHESRRRAAGDPVETPGFPTAPASFDNWPRPTVPRFVLESLPDVARAVLGTTSLPRGRHRQFDDLLLERRRRQKVSPYQAPSCLPAPANLVFDRSIVVRERDRDVFTGIALRHGDDYKISASGEIHALALAGPSGPAG